MPSQEVQVSECMQLNSITVTVTKLTMLDWNDAEFGYLGNCFLYPPLNGVYVIC